MSTTEGLWSGKLFKIKSDGGNFFSGGKRNLVTGWDWRNKKRKFWNDKSEERERKEKKGGNNNDKESRFRRDMEFEEEKRNLI